MHCYIDAWNPTRYSTPSSRFGLSWPSQHRQLMAFSPCRFVIPTVLTFFELGGCVDTSSQGIFAVLMAIGSEDVQRLRIGKLSPYTYVTSSNPVRGSASNLISSFLWSWKPPQAFRGFCFLLLVFSWSWSFRIEYLRHIKKFFGVQFQLEAEVESKTVLLTCLGSGFSNLGRKLL